MCRLQLCGSMLLVSIVREFRCAVISGCFTNLLLGPVSPLRSGVLRTQKLRTSLMEAQGYQRFPLSKPGVGILPLAYSFLSFFSGPVYITFSKNFSKQGPKGRAGTSDVSHLSGIAGLPFDSTFSICTLLLFWLVLLLLLSSPFLCFWPVLMPTFRKSLFSFFFLLERGLMVWPLF